MHVPQGHAKGQAPAIFHRSLEKDTEHMVVLAWLCNTLLYQDGNDSYALCDFALMHAVLSPCRMDVMRAAILGAAGTPYHDQLFFFDIQLAPDHPSTVPKVIFHSHGNRINPNLYVDGKASPPHPPLPCSVVASPPLLTDHPCLAHLQELES